MRSIVAIPYATPPAANGLVLITMKVRTEPIATIAVAIRSDAPPRQLTYGIRAKNSSALKMKTRIMRPDYHTAAGSIAIRR